MALMTPAQARRDWLEKGELPLASKFFSEGWKASIIRDPAQFRLRSLQMSDTSLWVTTSP